MADYASALRIDANFAAAYGNLGIAWRRKGEADRAIGNFDQAIKLIRRRRPTTIAATPGRPRATPTVPWPIWINPSDSIRALRRPLSIAATSNVTGSISPAPSLTTRLRSRSRPRRRLPITTAPGRDISTAKKTDALGDVVHAIELGIRSASAYSTRGLIRERAGDTSGATADFRQALRLDPEFQQPADGLQRLQAGAAKSQ